MKKRILFVAVLLGVTYIAWSMLLKLLPVTLVVLGGYFGYKAFKAIDTGKGWPAIKNLFLAYLFVVPGSIMNGLLVVHWDNLFKVFLRIFK